MKVDVRVSANVRDSDMTTPFAAAIRARSGRIYTGICLDLPCGIGFCAEHAAVAEMLESRETQLDSVVAVSGAGMLPPYGRCRELIALLHPGNFDAAIFITEDRAALLRDLLLEHWLNRGS